MPLVFQEMTHEEKGNWLKEKLEAHAQMLLNQVPEEPLVPPTFDFEPEDAPEPEKSYFGAQGGPVLNEEPLLSPEMDFASHE